MEKFKSIEELNRWREHLQKDAQSRLESSTTITIGMGTCGIAAGARQMKDALLAELGARDMDVEIVEVGCIGLCAQEPLLDIQQGAEPRVTYTNVTPKMVPQIIKEHLVDGSIVEKWVFARVQSGGHDDH